MSPHFWRKLGGLLAGALLAVASAFATPTISITSPASGSTIASATTPAGVTISATAAPTSSPAGIVIQSVQFFVDGTSIGTVGGSSPFSITWVPTSAGSHTITATVTDNSVPTTGTTPSVNTATATSIVSITTVRTISIIAPSDNSTYAQGSQVYLRSTATLSNAVISKVEFFRDATNLIATRTQAPYNALVDLSLANGFSVGAHTLTARVTASDNTTVDSATINLTIATATGAPPSIAITSPTGGAAVTLNQNATIVATATDSDGFIPANVGVTFFVDGDPIPVTVTGETNPDLASPFSITWKPTVAKSYVLAAQTTDDKGNTRVASVTVTASTTGASVTLGGSPAGGATINLGSPTNLSATATASTGATITQVEFFANGVLIPPADTTSPYGVTWTPNATGAVALTARVTDSFGVVATSAAVNVNVVGAATSTTITAPAAGTTFLVGGNAAITASASATSGATVASVEFLVNGVVIDTDTIAPYSTVWSPTSAGTFTLTSRVTDSFATVATSAGVSVNVVAPGTSGSTVALTSPADASTGTVGNAITVAASAGFTLGSSDRQVQFFDNGLSLGTDTTAPYSVSWTPSVAGAHALTAVLSETVNGTPNLVTSSAVNVTIASNPPTVALTAPTNNLTVPAGSMLYLKATASDSDGTVAKVEFYDNGALIGTVNSAPYNLANTFGSIGTHALVARAYDNDGTTTDSAAVNVNVIAAVGTGPALAISSPNGRVLVGQSVTIAATATDSDGVISAAGVTFLADGDALPATSGSQTNPDLTAPYALTWTPSVAKVYDLRVQATDDKGNIRLSPPLLITVATNTPPTVAISSPADDNAIAGVGQAFALTASASDPDPSGTISSVVFFANGTSIGTAAAVATAPGSYQLNWTPAVAGTFTLTAVATDNNGATTTSAARTITVSAVAGPPTVTITAPTGAFSIAAGSVRYINASASANAGRAIAKVELLFDGTVLKSDTTAPYSFLFAAPNSLGTHTLVVRATDTGGATRDASLPVEITAALGTGPTVALILPSNGATFAPGANVDLAASGSDADGFIANVQFFVDGVAVGAADTTFPFTGQAAGIAVGTHRLEALATDDKGNSTLSSPVTITAAFQSPTVRIVSPANNAQATPGAPLPLSAAVTLASGVTALRVDYFLDGVAIGSGTGASFIYSWVPTNAQVGTHLLTARVTDSNTLTATSAAVTVRVVAAVGQPPTISITAPANNAVVQSLSAVNFIANAFSTNTGGSITSVEFFVNDASIGQATREQTTNLFRLPYSFANFDVSALTADANGRFPLTVYALARDSNGNQTVSSSITVLLAPSTSSAPTVQLAANGGTSVSAGTAFPMTATLSDPDGTVTQLQLFVNGAASGGAIVNPAPQAPVTFTTSTAGRYNLYVVATDDTGNTAISSPPLVLTVTAITAPVTSVVRPADDTTVTTAGAPVFLEATASSPDSATLTVSFTAVATSGARTTVNATQVTGTTTYRAVWTPATAGTYTITSTALVPGTTTSSTSANSRRVTVNGIVGISPTITLNAPANNATVTTASTVNFTATATDSDGSVVDVEFFVGRNSVGHAVRDQLTNTWRLTVSFAGYPVGTTDIVALARDNAGNVNDPTATTNINVVAASSLPPTVTILSSDLNPAFSRQVQLTANARDTDGTVTSVQYFANGTSLGTSGNAGTNYLVNWTPNQSGTFNVWGVATDNSGNTTVAATIQVVVRRNNPVLENAAFILQTYQDIANTTTINPIVFANLDAQLGSGVLTRAQLVTQLSSDPAFVPPVNLLMAYYVIMGQWPTPANYNTLLPTARTSLPNAIGAILASNEYFAKYGAVPTPALLENPASAIPVQTFVTRLYANAGLGAPSATDVLRFRNNDTTFNNTLVRGYNVVGINQTIADFVTNVNATNAGLLKRSQAAALYYQLDRPTVSVTTDQIAARVLVLAALPDFTAMADAVLNDILYAYRYVTILSNPQSLVVAPRSGAIFSVDALGQPPLTYQWLLNGAPLAGATGPTLYLTNIDTSKVGNYTVVVSSAQATATSDGATLTLSSTPTRLANVSTRGPTTSGANVLIGGFVVTGTAGQTRQMLIRVVGPTLAGAPYNVPGTLADPRLEVYSSTSSTPILTNDNWGTQTGGAAAVTAIQQATTRANAFALPNGSADAVVLANLAPGSYTVQAKGPNATASGLVLFEVYDVTQGSTAGPKAINVSTRGNVGTGDNILIAGFVVNGAVARRVLIRGVGPTLADPRFGLPAGSTLSDPQLTLIDQSTGNVVKVNDDWGTNADDAAAIAAAATAGGAFALQTGSKDAAMLVMLPPGTYTVKLNGAGNATGIAIVEVYDVDP